MNKKGFTLMELMITVCIVGILAAITIPSYTAHMQRGRMAQAYADIQAVALAEEKCFSETNKYITSWSNLGTSYGIKFAQSTPYYVITIRLPTSVPANSQFVIYALNTPSSVCTNPIKRMPCIRSDGLQGYTTTTPTTLDMCAPEEWTGR